MKDPDFVKEATRLALEVPPVSGTDVDKLIREVYASPPDVVKRAADIERQERFSRNSLQGFGAATGGAAPPSEDSSAARSATRCG
jgi:hypothetical protein